MEQAPGPRGSPHDPQGPLGLAAAADSWDFSPRTAKLESCWLSRLLSHLGQAAFCVPRTIASNSWWHCWQTYSKIGILDGSGKIVIALIIIGQPKPLTTKDTKKHEVGPEILTTDKH
jgi:hypothetical protein